MTDTEKNMGAEGVTWNLGDLYASAEDPALMRDFEQADLRAEALAGKYKGRVAELTAAELETLLTEYESILELGEKPGSFAYLSWTCNTEDPARGALLQKMTERGSRLAQALLFVELEWANAGDERAAKLMADRRTARWRHWLEVTRLFKPYLLSEPEERIIKEKSVTGREAWVRFFEETHSARLYDWEGGKAQQEVLLSKLYHPDRDLRRRAASALTAGLREDGRASAFALNTLLADKASEDRMRKYPAWITARNLSNQVDDAVVEALVSAVTSRYDIVARYYRLKKRILGLDVLYDYDRYAPISSADRKYTWAETRDMVLPAFRAFHPRLAEIASLFFEKRWIDAEVRRGKRGGGYCAPTVPSLHPYVFVNFQGTFNDVMTVAHELGHGAHGWLAREKGILQQSTPLTMAETASTFGESLVFQDLFSREKDPAVRLAMLVREIEGAFATIFRQVAMNRFEDAVHAARRSEGELSIPAVSEAWLGTQKAMFADSVELTEDYGIWWSYVGHFYFAPGYVYAYAFGDLLVRALYAKYLAEGGDFAERYLAMLSAGGSDWPHLIVEPLGVDLRDPSFWKQGLGLLEDMVAQAEDLAGKTSCIFPKTQ